VKKNLRRPSADENRAGHFLIRAPSTWAILDFTPRWRRPAAIQAIRLPAGRLGFVMPFWYGLSLAFLVVGTFFLRHRPQALLLAIASSIWALVIVLSLLFLGPINRRLTRCL
jgi:hypothetical protein